MTKDIISKIALYATAISIITFVIGTLIINNHLAGYKIVDFNLLKPHAIAVGFTCVLFLIVNALYVSIFIKWDDIKLNSPSKLFFISFCKLVFICNIFFVLFGGAKIIQNSTYSIGPIFLDNFIIVNLLHYSIIGIPVFLNNYRDINIKKRNWFNILLRFIAYWGLLCGTLLFIIFFNYPLYFRFFVLEGGIIFGFYIFFIVARGSGDTTTATKKNEEIVVPTFFSHGLMKGKVLYLFFSFAVLQALGYLIFLIFGYTKVMFPKIEQYYGGGKLQSISYVISGDTISGKKVYETEKYIFLSLQDSSIQKLDWDKIDRILK